MNDTIDSNNPIKEIEEKIAENEKLMENPDLEEKVIFRLGVLRLDYSMGVYKP